MEDTSENLDLIRTMTQPMLQHPREGHYPGESTISFLPVIDLEPTDMTLVYSTLSFMWAYKALQCDTNIATFDEPLWWKAIIIITTNEHSS